jgi:hypothetical protein
VDAGVAQPVKLTSKTSEAAAAQAHNNRLTGRAVTAQPLEQSERRISSAAFQRLGGLPRAGGRPPRGLLGGRLALPPGA